MSVVLTRSQGEVVCIGDEILVTVVEVRSGSVRLAFTTPRDVRVDRAEVRLRQQQQQKEADNAGDE